MHIYISKKHGVVITSVKDLMVHPSGDKRKYMGYTFDIGYPKLLNTGRILYEPRKKRKPRKLPS
jgi:hypothetical protein